MDTAESAHYFCHACTTEFTAAAQCPRCGSDFIERIEATDDPRQFALPPRMPGWVWSFGHRPVTLCVPGANVATTTTSSSGEDNNAGISSSCGAVYMSNVTNTDNTNNTGNTTSADGTGSADSTSGACGASNTNNASNVSGAYSFSAVVDAGGSAAGTSDGVACSAPATHLSLSAQFETMLQNILSSIVGSNATVDIALCNSSGRHDTHTHEESSSAPAEETERSRPNSFIFRRSFIWSRHPSEQQEALQGDNTGQNTGQEIEQSTSQNTSQNTTQRTEQDAQEGTRTTRIPIHDLASFLENAFGSGFPEDGLTTRSLSGFFSNIFTMRNPGDYVWSSTGFDNIITQLMEQYPSTNAPPPASDEVINALPKTIVEEKEELKDCAICKENYQLKEVYITLPCKHYFHDNCIIPWLKINNTCAICRATVGTNIPNQFPNSEGDKEDDKSKDFDSNMEDQLEQEPPD